MPFGGNPLTGRSGPAPQPPRDGDKVQARQRINVEVRTGRRPHPNALPCAGCGHVWREGERRHEYDHHLGYAAAHHGDVASCASTRFGRCPALAPTRATSSGGSPVSMAAVVGCKASVAKSTC